MQINTFPGRGTDDDEDFARHIDHSLCKLDQTSYHFRRKAMTAVRKQKRRMAAMVLLMRRLLIIRVGRDGEADEIDERGVEEGGDAVINNIGTFLIGAIQ